jgi:hypothetical protein
LPDIKLEDTHENSLPSLLQPDNALNLPPTLPVELDETAPAVAWTPPESSEKRIGGGNLQVESAH